MSEEVPTTANNFGETTSVTEEAPANNAGLTANNAGISANSAEVAANNAEVAANNTEVAANNTGVSANNTGVSANNAGVTANNAGVTANNTGVTANNTGVSANNTGVSANNTGVTANNVEEQPANTAVTGENELAAKLNTTSGTKKRGQSVAAKSLLDDRMKTYAELKAAYAAKFGDDKKAPKAKSYEAFALHKIRKDQGEEAFQAKMEEYITRNEGKFTNPAPKGKSKKAVKFNSSHTLKSASPVASANVMESVRIMGSTAKGLIDSMIKTMSLAKTNPEKAAETANTAIFTNGNKLNVAANSTKSKKPRKKRSNAGSSRKKREPNTSASSGISLSNL